MLMRNENKLRQRLLCVQCRFGLFMTATVVLNSNCPTTTLSVFLFAGFFRIRIWHTQNADNFSCFFICFVYHFRKTIPKTECDYSCSRRDIGDDGVLSDPGFVGRIWVRSEASIPLFDEVGSIVLEDIHCQPKVPL